MHRRKIALIALPITLVVIPLLLILLSRPLLRETVWGPAWGVMERFASGAAQVPPARWIRAWVQPEKAKAGVGPEEELAQYQLRILVKSLDQYFKMLLNDTATLARQTAVKNRLTAKTSDDYGGDIRSMLTDHLQNHMDLTEVTLYGADGARVQTLRYKSAEEYRLGEKVFEALKTRENLLLKQGSTGSLVLVSAVRFDGKLAGAVSQTLHPVFFTKILDFLGLSSRVFYVRNAGGDLIVDNVDAAKRTRPQASGLGNLFIKQTTRHDETSAVIKVDGVDYTVGALVEKNTLGGQIASFFILVLIAGVGAGLSFVLAWQGLRLVEELRKGGSDGAPAPLDNAAPPGGPGAAPSELAALDREIERLEAQAPRPPDGPVG